MGLADYYVKRIGQSIITIVGAMVISYLAIRAMPGGPMDYIAAELRQQYAGQISRQELNRRAELYTTINPEEGYIEGFINYFGSLVFEFDFGQSIVSHQPVWEIIGPAMPWTVFISVFGLVIGTVFFFTIGGLLAYYEGSKLDVAGSYFVIFTDSIPYYIVALFLLFLMGYEWSLFPTAGRYGAGTTPGFNLEFMHSALYHAGLPILSIAVTSFGGLSFRAHCIRIHGEDYVRVAHLRGLSDSRIAFRYIAWNSALPAYTGIMMGLAALFGSSVILEEIFQYRGMGLVIFEATVGRDYPVLMAGFLLFTVATVLGLLIADLTYGRIDPRAGYKDRESYSGESSLFRSISTSISKVTGRGSATDDEWDESALPLEPDEELMREFQEKAKISESNKSSMSRSERYTEAFDQFVAAPLRVLWTAPRARVGIYIIGAFLLLGTVGTRVIPRHSMYQADSWLGPMENPRYPLGTDDVGRDILAQLVHSTPAMFEMMFAGGFVALLLGVGVGITSGYVGGNTDKVLMTLTDIMLNLPGLPLLLVLAAVFEPREPYLVGVILAIDSWPGMARSIRSQVLTIRGEHYVEASRTMGLGIPTILSKNMLSRLMPYVMINLVGGMRNIIFESAGLYYLGVLPFTNENWGVMLNFARQSGALLSTSQIHYLLAPTAAIVTLTYGLMLFSQGTDRIFNPRIRARHAKTVTDDDVSAGPESVASEAD